METYPKPGNAYAPGGQVQAGDEVIVLRGVLRWEGQLSPSEPTRPFPTCSRGGLGGGAGPGIERRRSGRPQERPLLTYIDTSVLAAHHCLNPEREGTARLGRGG